MENFAYEQGLKFGMLAFEEAASNEDKTIIAFGMVPKHLVDEYDIEGSDMIRGFTVGLMKSAKMVV